MKPRTVKMILAILLLFYLASYFLCRKVYETHEDEFITLYDKNSLIAIVAHMMHEPLIAADSAITGRRIEVGKWRRGPLPEEMGELDSTNKAVHLETEKR